MKKIAILIIVFMLVLTAAPLTAFAHGHGGSMRANQAYSLCDTENCNATGAHYHGDTYYYGHYYTDGHDYHRLCGVQGCTLTGVHEHDGVACFAHYSSDGHVYHHNSANNARGHH